MYSWKNKHLIVHEYHALTSSNTMKLPAVRGEEVLATSSGFITYRYLASTSLTLFIDIPSFSGQFLLGSSRGYNEASEWK